MSRNPGKPAAPRSTAPSGARVLSDLSGSEAMQEARRRRERALAVGIPANSDADVLIAPPILGATIAATQTLPPPSLARRVFDSAMVAGAFMLGVSVFAPITGYAALGKLPFEIGAPSEAGPSVPGFARAALSAPPGDAAQTLPRQIPVLATGGPRPPQPPGLATTPPRDSAPIIAVAGSVFATALTTDPVAATPGEGDAPLQLAALSQVDRPGLTPLGKAAIDATLPSVQGQVFDASVFVHAPQSARTSALAAAAILNASGLSAELTDPVTFGISTSNVRFFYAEDRVAAAEVARLLNAELRDFTSFRPSPRLGTVEVWVAGRSTAPALREVPVSSISSLPIPEALAPLPEAERRSGFLSRLLGGGNRGNRPLGNNDRDDDNEDDRFSNFAATATPAEDTAGQSTEAAEDNSAAAGTETETASPATDGNASTPEAGSTDDTDTSPESDPGTDGTATEDNDGDADEEDEGDGD